MKLIMSFVMIMLFIISACSNKNSTEMSGNELVEHKCSVCHTTARISSGKRSAEEWEQILSRMIRHGAELDKMEQDKVMRYLVEQYGTH